MSKVWFWPAPADGETVPEYPPVDITDMIDPETLRFTADKPGWYHVQAKLRWPPANGENR